MKKGVRMADIAAELGVSVVTVSNALNDRSGVSAEMRRKIRKRASELGYRPSTPRLSRGDQLTAEAESGSIGILSSERFAEARGSFYWYLTAGISRELTHCKLYSVFESVSAADERACTLPQMIAERQVRGVIVVGQLAADYLDRLVSAHIPLLFLDFYGRHSEIDTVISDSFYDSYRLTEQLALLGHRNIGFIGTVRATSSIQDRFLGYIKCLMENRLPFRRDWTIDDRLSDGTALEQIDFPDELPTAFVCNCDETAFRVIEMLRQKGLRVPEDISVTGYDNFTAMEMREPTLTTVEVDLKKMAHTAVSVLLARIREPRKPAARHVIPGRVVVRTSISPPREAETEN